MGYGLLLKLGAVGVVLAFFFALGWRYNGARLNKRILSLERQLATAEHVVKDYEESVRKYQIQVTRQNEDIMSLQLNGQTAAKKIDSLNERLVDLDNEWQAKYNRLVLAPLPEDCESAVREAIKRLQELIK